MDADKLIHPTNTPRAASWWSARRVCVVLILLFAVIFAASWWLTPIEAYATLNLDDGCSLCLFSPDGTMFVTAGQQSNGRFEGPLRVWDVERGHERFSLAHDWKEIQTVRFSPDGGFLAATEMKGNLTLWNVRTGEEFANFRPEQPYFAFSPDGRFLALYDWSFVKFWNIETRREQSRIETFLSILGYAPDGNSFATFRQKDGWNMIELWKMEKNPGLAKQHKITGNVNAVSPDLKMFAAEGGTQPDGNGQIAMWDMVTGEQRWSVPFNKSDTQLYSLSFLANGRILSVRVVVGGTDYRTTLWDVTAIAKKIGPLSETPTVSPDGEWGAIRLNSGGGVKLISFSPSQRGNDLIAHDDLGISTASFSPDSKMILVTGLYRASQRPFLASWLPEKYNPFSAVPEKSVARVWDTDSHREMTVFFNCSEVWFSPDGHVLATLREDRKAIDLWKVPFRASLWRIFGWAVFVWLVVVSVGWAGIKIRRKVFSRTKAPLPHPESSDGKQQLADSREPPHDPSPPLSNV